MLKTFEPARIQFWGEQEFTIPKMPAYKKPTIEKYELPAPYPRKIHKIQADDYKKYATISVEKPKIFHPELKFSRIQMSDNIYNPYYYKSPKLPVLDNEVLIEKGLGTKSSLKEFHKAVYQTEQGTPNKYNSLLNIDEDADTNEFVKQFREKMAIKKATPEARKAIENFKELPLDNGAEQPIKVVSERKMTVDNFKELPFTAVEQKPINFTEIKNDAPVIKQEDNTQQKELSEEEQLQNKLGPLPPEELKHIKKLQKKLGISKKVVEEQKTNTLQEEIDNTKSALKHVEPEEKKTEEKDDHPEEGTVVEKVERIEQLIKEKLTEGNKVAAFSILKQHLSKTQQELTKGEEAYCIVEYQKIIKSDVALDKYLRREYADDMNKKLSKTTVKKLISGVIKYYKDIENPPKKKVAIIEDDISVETKVAKYMK